MLFQQKNILQNGEKTTGGALSSLVPFAKAPKSQMNVEVQKDQTNFLPNIDFNLPEKISTNEGIMTRVSSPTAISSYNKIASRANMIDYENKSVGYSGIHPNYGVAIEDLLKFYSSLISRGLVDKNLVGYTATNAIVELLVPEILAERETGEISQRYVELSNRFKTAMYDVLKTAEGNFYRKDQNAYNTALMDQIKEYTEVTEEVAKLSRMDGKQAADFISEKLSTAKANIYDYQKTESPYKTDKTSKFAKEKILNNQWYLSYVNSISESNPELFEQLEMSASSPYITNIEEKVIQTILQNNNELMNQKQLLEDEYGWEYMNNIFSAPQSNGASLNDLLNMRWELDKTALDDEIESSFGDIEVPLGTLEKYYSSIDSSSKNSYTNSEKKTLNASQASKILAKEPQGSSSPGMRVDELTGELVQQDYEADKLLPAKLGKAHALTDEEWEKLENAKYKNIREKNLQKLIN